MSDFDWERCLTNEIKQINQSMRDINAQLLKLHIEVAGLKVKSGVWGLIGGLIPVIIMIAFFAFKN